MPAFILLPLTAALTVVLAGQLLLVAYLLLLTLLAMATPSRPPPGPGTRRFALLIPAHNEAAVIGRLLSSVADLAYPASQVDVCVVADNCDDTTASIARSFGARVYERVNPDERAKGFALHWLLERLREEGRGVDAFVVLDADSVVAPDLLQCMDARLERGAQVIQAHYAVLNSSASAVAGLRQAALAAVHYLRPLGRARLGFSCGLKGNGMCFAAPILERFPWRWYSLAEDVEFHLALVESGIRVEFAPEARVEAEMPVTLRQAASQNSRWEQGRLQLIREHVPRLVRAGLRERSLVHLDVAAEELIPPLSAPFALGMASLAISLLLGASALAVLAAACLVGQVVYIIAALALTRAPLRVYLALGAAPVYIAWKVGLYARALAARRASAWVRTTRVTTSA
jgi:1,2-diacylglycerol 3-beta-glucosyltransferase